MKIAASSQLSTRYTLLEFLGEGQYGTVWRCQEKATGELFALKYIDLAKCSSRARLAALSEVEILYKIRDSGFSDSIVSLKDVYGDDQSLYLVMELCSNGDLLELIQKQPGAFLSEAESRHVFSSVARAVKQCHSCNVVHRDIKPENILLCPTNSKTASPASSPASAASPTAQFNYTAKLADFGLAVDLPWWQQIRGYAGSKPYEAPEVMANTPYDELADIWSLGVTLYAMLSGKWPLFKGGKRVLDNRADFASADWTNVSEEAKHLLRRMMTVDVNERLSIDEVLAHPWVAGREAAAQDAMETVDLPEERTAAVASQTDADITFGIAEADSKSTATSATLFSSQANSTVTGTADTLPAVAHDVPATKRSNTVEIMHSASSMSSGAVSDGSSNGGSNAGQKRQSGKFSPRSVLKGVMKVFSPLKKQRDASSPIELL